jgi:hydrogenase nickel incorporation protein HypB
MCSVCGCSTGEVKIGGAPVVHLHGRGHDHGEGHHHHDDDHGHDHAHAPHDHHHAEDGSVRPAAASRLIAIEADILSHNNAHAAANRARLDAGRVLALNIVSSPGSGKTSLLVETLKLLKGKTACMVIEGDQETSNDAARIRETGAPAVQVNTGRGCHLDAAMVGHALDHLEPLAEGVLFIENVGNLVCPAGFDLGEAHKVVVLSVTEGEDKPLKYPHMFAAADLMVISKVDLVPHLDIDMAALIDNARKVNPRIGVLKVSVKTGVGLAAWLDWIAAARALRAAAA